MRTTLTIAALACCVAAQPALSREAAIPPGGTLLQRLAAEARAPMPGLAILPDIHLHIEFAEARVTDLLDSPESSLRRRFASSMMDFYPVVGQGFHFSGGLRFYSRTNFARDAELATHGLLLVPRGTSSGMGVRGYKRMTPAATFGYTQVLDSGLMLGIEGGTLFGRVNPGMPRVFRELRADSIGNDRSSSMNPIVNLALGFKF